MPQIMLYIDGNPLELLPTDGKGLLHHLFCMSSLISRALAFLDTPLRHIPSETKSLYVVQGEYGLVDRDLVIGSSDATTCIILCALGQTAVSPPSALVCHIDERIHKSHAAIARALLHLAPGADVYLAGGYSDPRGVGEGVAAATLLLLHALPQPMHLQLCCVGDLNTDSATGAPRSTSLALDLRGTRPSAAAAPFPAAFDCGGGGRPLLPARQAQLWQAEDSSQWRSVYDAKRRVMTLVVTEGGVGELRRRQFEKLQRCDDATLLQLTSTSPEHEPPGFVPGEAGHGWEDGARECALREEFLVPVMV
jgi:hypothetical protein